MGGALFWVVRGGWEKFWVCGGVWGRVGMCGGEWGWVHCLRLPPFQHVLLNRPENSSSPARLAY